MTTDITCNSQGKRKCSHNEEVCQNEIRQFPIGNTIQTFITKRCKSRRACRDNYQQNWINPFPQNQCNPDQKYSVCRCCCEGDDCNHQAISQACLSGVAVVKFSSSCEPRPLIPQNGTVCCEKEGDNSCKPGFSLETQTAVTRPGDVCRFICDNGYKLDQSERPTTKCLEDGQWSDGFEATCSLQQCQPDLAAMADKIANGTVICSEENWYKSNCHVYCDQGFVLSDPKKETFTCDVSNDQNNWGTLVWVEDQTMFEYVPTQMSAKEYEDFQEERRLKQIEYYSNQQYYGPTRKNARFGSMTSGFNLAGTSPAGGVYYDEYANTYSDDYPDSSDPDYYYESETMTRAENGQFFVNSAAAILPTCTRITCKTIPLKTNMQMECSDKFYYDSVCKISCNYGYTVSPSTSDVLTCKYSSDMLSGEWDYEIPICV